MVHFRAPPAISGTECPHLRQSGLSTRPCLWHLPPWIQRHVAKWVVSGWPSGWSVVDPLGHFSLSNHCRMCYRICGELRNSNWLPSSVNTIGLSNVPSVDSSYRVLDPRIARAPHPCSLPICVTARESAKRNTFQRLLLAMGASWGHCQHFSPNFPRTHFISGSTFSTLLHDVYQYLNDGNLVRIFVSCVFHIFQADDKISINVA